MTDPERTADVGERDGRHLVVKFGRHGSDEDAAEAEQGLDIHGVCQPFSIGCGRWNPGCAGPGHRRGHDHPRVAATLLLPRDHVTVDR
jgi:hypothetical protein